MRRKGIPPRLRGYVWHSAIGNKLGLTPELQAIYERHARAEIAKGSNYFCFCIKFHLIGGDTARLLEVDLPRTFPETHLFHEMGTPEILLPY